MTETIVRIRHRFFRSATPISIALGIALILFISFGSGSVDWKVIVTAVSVILSLIYFIQKQKLEELQLFTNLFNTFNERYDQMNEELNRISEEKANAELATRDREILIDYFNLCGEEYLYYRLGYIFPEVWEAWLHGMKYYYKKSYIRTLWDQELQTDSYYGLHSNMLK